MARSFVAEMLEAWGEDELESPARLVTSELVTNAVLHASSQRIVVTAKLDRHLLRIEVADGATELPHPLHVSAGSEHGRGLLLVEALSQRWGARRREGGKVVWFELATAANGARPDGKRPSRALS